MKIITKTLAIILLAFLSNNLCAESGPTYQDEIFISNQNIYFSDEKIIVKIDDEFYFIDQFRENSDGIFCSEKNLDKITDRCVNGHKVFCIPCWGCVVRYCKFRCKHYEWE